MRYALARQSIFRTIQGEGVLLGRPMTFIRLAGCSVGCPLCDTDYAVAQRATAEQIADQAHLLAKVLLHKKPWAWITGGEPTDHDLQPLLTSLRQRNFTIAVATSGHRAIPEAWLHGPDHLHFLSVSPHVPGEWRQRQGHELKLIPGLKGFHLLDFEPLLQEPGCCFEDKFVLPCEGIVATVLECQQFVETHPDWRMGCQAHKQWGLP